MTAFFLLALPVIAFAAFRALRVRLGPPSAAGIAVAVAAAATLPPLAVFRSSPPEHPPRESRRAATQLTVEFLGGWEDPAVDTHGRTIRRMGGSAELAVGQLVAGRPPASLSFRVRAVDRARRLTARGAGRLLATVHVRSEAVVELAIPPGRGPAVVTLEATPPDDTTFAVDAESVRARVARPR